MPDTLAILSHGLASTPDGGGDTYSITVEFEEFDIDIEED